MAAIKKETLTFLLTGQVGTKITEWNNKRLIYTLLYADIHNRPQVYRIGLTTVLNYTIHRGFQCEKGVSNYLETWVSPNSSTHWGTLRSARMGDGTGDINICFFPGAIPYCSQTSCVHPFQSCPRVTRLHLIPLPLTPITVNGLAPNSIAVSDKDISE